MTATAKLNAVIELNPALAEAVEEFRAAGLTDDQIVQRIVAAIDRIKAGA